MMEGIPPSFPVIGGKNKVISPATTASRYPAPAFKPKESGGMTDHLGLDTNVTDTLLE